MTNQSLNRIGTSLLLLVFLAIAIAIVANVANHTHITAEQHVFDGNAVHGAAAIYQYGCGTCHQIPGIRGADGMAGPTLEKLSERSILAGHLSNNPDNLILWIEHPQHVLPGNSMPELGVSDTDARDIAAYLYSLH
jgi:cytochrome c